MKRLTNPEVAHSWAHNIHQSATGGNFWHDGAAIFSYRTLIGQITTDKAGNKIAIVCSERYSATTSTKHMPNIRRAIHGVIPVYYAPLGEIMRGMTNDEIIYNAKEKIHKLIDFPDRFVKTANKWSAVFSEINGLSTLIERLGGERRELISADNCLEWAHNELKDEQVKKATSFLISELKRAYDENSSVYTLETALKNTDKNISILKSYKKQILRGWSAHSKKLAAMILPAKIQELKNEINRAIDNTKKITYLGILASLPRLKSLGFELEKLGAHNIVSDFLTPEKIAQFNDGAKNEAIGHVDTSLETIKAKIEKGKKALLLPRPNWLLINQAIDHIKAHSLTIEKYTNQFDLEIDFSEYKNELNLFLSMREKRNARHDIYDLIHRINKAIKKSKEFDFIGASYSAIDRFINDELLRAVKLYAEKFPNLQHNKFKKLNAEYKKALEFFASATQKRLDDWRDCKNSIGSFGYSEKIYLRLNTEKELIETSRSAAIPVSQAARIWSLVNKAIGSNQDINLQEMGITKRIGHFNLDVVFSSGAIKAGCHYIEFDQLQYIAEKLGFIGGENEKSE